MRGQTGHSPINPERVSLLHALLGVLLADPPALVEVCVPSFAQVCPRTRPSPRGARYGCSDGWPCDPSPSLRTARTLPIALGSTPYATDPMRANRSAVARNVPLRSTTPTRSAGGPPKPSRQLGCPILARLVRRVRVG